MIKTTLYLPDDLKVAVKRAAESCGLSEAEFVRKSLRTAVEQQTPPEPTVGFFDLGDPGLSERVDELLKGFGTR
jgi:hypothetical protein